MLGFRVFWASNELYIFVVMQVQIDLQLKVYRSKGCRAAYLSPWAQWVGWGRLGQILCLPVCLSVWLLVCLGGSPATCPGDPPWRLTLATHTATHLFGDIFVNRERSTHFRIYQNCKFKYWPRRRSRFHFLFCERSFSFCLPKHLMLRPLSILPP